MERSWREVGTADVLLLVVDQTIGCGETEQNILRTKPDQVPALIVFNKIDLARDGAEFAIPNYWGYPCVGVSAKTGAGMDSFDNALGTVVGVSASSGEDLFMARERHLDALKLANECIERAMAETQEARLELLAEELRLAQEALGSITGAISSDELLGEIFRRFCIGK
jgi:tRNA modification GTPase